MNITTKMIAAGLHEGLKYQTREGHIHYNYNCVQDILKAAVTAAPTPPARDEVNSLMVVGYGWHQKYEIQSYVVTKEFGLTCYLKEPAAVAAPEVEHVAMLEKRCVDLNAENARLLVELGKRSTTPPEVEPVAEIVSENMGHAAQIRAHFYKEIPPIGTKLYTHPADNELRKAAEEFVRWYDSLEPENSIHAITLIHNLRAALGKS